MKTLLLAIVIVFSVGAGVMGFLQFQKQSKLEQEIQDIRNRKDQVMKLDSLHAVVEKQMLDSLKSQFASRDAKIKALEVNLDKTRKQNAELEKKYNSIRVDMPDL